MVQGAMVALDQLLERLRIAPLDPFAQSLVGGRDRRRHLLPCARRRALQGRAVPRPPRDASPPPDPRRAALRSPRRSALSLTTRASARPGFTAGARQQP